MTSHIVDIMAETPAKHADLVEALFDKTFGPGHFAKTAERFREFNHSLPDINRIGMAGDQLVAATRVWPVMVEQGGRALFIGPVAVSPECRGSKLGLKVTLEAMSAAKQAGWHGAILIGSPSYFGEIGFRHVPEGTFQFPAPQDPSRVLIADLAGGAGVYSGRIRT